MPATFNGVFGVATLDFGTNSDVASVVVSDTNVRAPSGVVLTLGGPSVDHDVEDALLEQISLAAEVTPFSGFTIWAHAPNGTWGQYNVQYHCTYF